MGIYAKEVYYMSNEFSEGELNVIKSFSPNTTSFYTTVESDITKFENKEYLEVLDLYHVQVPTSNGKVDPYISEKFSNHKTFEYSIRHISEHERHDIFFVSDCVENMKNEFNDFFEKELKYSLQFNTICAYKGSLFVFDIVPNNIVVKKQKFVKIDEIEHTLSTNKNIKKHNTSYIKVDSLFEYNNTNGKVECENIGKELWLYYETLRKEYKDKNIEEISRKIKLYDDDFKEREMKEKLDNFNKLKKELNL